METKTPGFLRSYCNAILHHKQGGKQYIRGRSAMYVAHDLLQSFVDSVLQSVLLTVEEIFMSSSDVVKEIKESEVAFFSKTKYQTGSTWGTEKYSKLGFQCQFVLRRVHVRLVEFSNMFVRAYNAGILRKGMKRIVLIGGGPGYEGIVFKYLYSHFFGEDLDIVSYDPVDWSSFNPTIERCFEEWNDAHIECGDILLASYVLEHYVSVSYDYVQTVGAILFSLEREYFDRPSKFFNLKDYTGRDRSVGVYLDYKYDPAFYHLEPLPFVRVEGDVCQDPLISHFGVDRVPRRIETIVEIAGTGHELAYDWGCGDQDITRAMRGVVARRVVGIDTYLSSDPDYVAARDVENVPTGSGDLITALQVIHHIKTEDLPGVVCEMNRILKRGGYLFIREHDTSMVEIPTLHAVHFLGGAMRRDRDEAYKDYYARYRDFESLSAVLLMGGFRLERKIVTTRGNWQGIYHALYRKVRDCKRFPIRDAERPVVFEDVKRVLPDLTRHYSSKFWIVPDVFNAIVENSNSFEVLYDSLQQARLQ